jgi:hypothetical protein
VITRVFFWWGVIFAVLGTVGVLFFGFDNVESMWLFYGVFAFMAVLSAVLAITGRGRTLIGGVRALPDASPPVPLLALATILGALGAEFGFWLALIAAGVGLVAIGGLIREARAQRADLAAARAAEGDPIAVPARERA